MWVFSLCFIVTSRLKILWVIVVWDFTLAEFWDVFVLFCYFDLTCLGSGIFQVSVFPEVSGLRRLQALFDLGFVVSCFGFGFGFSVLLRLLCAL